MKKNPLKYIQRQVIVQWHKANLSRKDIAMIMSIFIVIGISFVFGQERDALVESMNTQEYSETQEAPSVHKNEILDIDTARKIGMLMKCTYPLEQSDTGEAIVLIQGDSYRSEYTQNGAVYGSMYDSQGRYHTWDTVTFEGVTLDASCFLDSQYAEPSEDLEDQKDMRSIALDSFLQDAQDLKCFEVDSLDMNLPQEIKFFDECNLLKNQMEMIRDLQ